jgi:DNA-binding CsgD family transcriptional regulator
MSYPMSSPRETAIDHWNHALQTYRASVDLYTRVLKIRHSRDSRLAPTATSAPTPVDFAPAPPPIFDDLTPREREVALLIARGFSNRQIAQHLVITQGTAANHVAHIIEKLCLPNRTRVAAAVVAQTRTLDSLSDFEPLPHGWSSEQHWRAWRSSPSTRPTGLGSPHRGLTNNARLTSQRLGITPGDVWVVSGAATAVVDHRIDHVQPASPD